MILILINKCVIEILGLWHFSFADMPYYTRMIAKTIFGTPPSSTYEEALRHFEKAELIQVLFWLSRFVFFACGLFSS